MQKALPSFKIPGPRPLRVSVQLLLRALYAAHLLPLPLGSQAPPGENKASASVSPVVPGTTVQQWLPPGNPAWSVATGMCLKMGNGRCL